MNKLIRLILLSLFTAFPILFQACNRPLVPLNPYTMPTNTPVLAATATQTSTHSVTITLSATPVATSVLTGSPTTVATVISTSTAAASVTFTLTPVITGSPTSVSTVISTATSISTANMTPTVTGTVGVNCAAQTILNFTGNLNSAQRADQSGGVLQLGTASFPTLPLAFSPYSFNYAKATLGAYQSGQAIFQIADYSLIADTATLALPNHTTPLMTGGESLTGARGQGISFAWNEPGAYQPACKVTKSIVDSTGATRQIQILFYQVNDLGTASPAVNPNPPHQAAYAWYAFETTGGQQPSTSNLFGGTGVFEGDIPSKGDFSYNRCVAGNIYWGDFLYFNSDGSLASEGGTEDSGTSGTQDKPYLYLPLGGSFFDSTSPNPPAYVIELNFGTAGLLGYGLKDGITGNAAPSLVH